MPSALALPTPEQVEAGNSPTAHMLSPTTELSAVSERPSEEEAAAAARASLTPGPQVSAEHVQCWGPDWCHPPFDARACPYSSVIACLHRLASTASRGNNRVLELPAGAPTGRRQRRLG